MTDIDIDAAIFNPAKVFKKPEEILNDTKIKLTREQKIRALQTWRYDIQLASIAADEGENRNIIDPNVPNLEEEIIKAIHTLESEKAT